ncbi:hypothetical protein IAR50_001026 [Cryptococcus sp. DSM 104548]
MASSSQLKKASKRKSTAGHGEITIDIAEGTTGVAPSFANFPAVKPSKNTAFGVYTRDPGSRADFSQQHTLVAGETEDVEYFSTNRDRQTNTEGSDCQYLPAVYDPSTKTLHVHPSTPLYLFAHRVKRLRTAPVSAPPAQAAKAQWRQERNDLGEAFGTRKAKAQIKSEERNKVNADAMKDAKGHLMETIGELQKEDEVTAPSDIIPTPNLETNDPSEVYPREAVIPNQEWSSIDVSQMLRTEDDKERIGYLPSRRSFWVQNKCRLVYNIKDKAVKKTQMKYLYYLSCLLQFLDFAPRLSKTAASELTSKFPGVPQQILDGLITRFSEQSGKKHAVTEKTKAKLLSWICLLYLTLDGYSVEVGRIAKDLKMEPAKVATYYKQLGCNVKLASPAEREAQGITLAEAGQMRRAVMVAPVKFPKTKRRGPAQH